MLLSPFAFPYFYPVFYYECSDTGCQMFFLRPLVGTTVFFEPFFSDYLLENDFVKNKPAVRCIFPYFSGLFSKSIFHLFTSQMRQALLVSGHPKERPVDVSRASAAQ